MGVRVGDGIFFRGGGGWEWEVRGARSVPLARRVREAPPAAVQSRVRPVALVAAHLPRPAARPPPGAGQPLWKRPAPALMRAVRLYI